MTEIPYLFFILSILLAITNNLLYHKAPTWGFRGAKDSILFCSAMSCVWMLILLIWTLCSGRMHFDWQTVLFGALYAVILCSFQYFKMQSMASGPLSLTSLIASCSFIPVVLFSLAFYSEIPSICQIIGMVGLVLSMLVSNLSKSGGKANAKWAFNCFILFLAGAGIGIVYKMFGKSEASENANEMLLIASAISAILYFILAFAVKTPNQSTCPRLPKKSWAFVVFCGITGCVYIRMNITLSGLIPSAVFFPVFNGSTILFSTLGGLIFYRERLSRQQWIGIGIGLLSIVINGCGDVLFG